MAEEERFTHFTQSGAAHMVPVGTKQESQRQAVAEGSIRLSSRAFSLVREGSVGKGDVLGVARIAGIMAAKRVDQLIPLCHPLAITGVELDLTLDEQEHRIAITATVATLGRTGVEMEALTAVAVAALTIYDMCKAVDKAMTIDNIRLVRKSGGKSGLFVHPGIEEEGHDK
ncbi:MAG: cyclic pyranopterin monophosphate synthase MoaC [Desulfobulbaceae bacterium]|nr:cyclic pyranopterin monophosphate synthase MoaC [Desulfobulbaceae bacterium]